MPSVLPTTNKSFQLADILSLGYLVFILLIAAVPASLWVPLKGISVSIVLGLTIFALGDRNRLKSVWGPGAILVIGYLLAITGLTLYTLYSERVGLSDAGSAAARYVVVVLLVVAGFLSFRWGILTASSILGAIFIGHFGYLIIKVGALVAARAMGLDSEEIMAMGAVLAPGATIHGFRDNEGFVRIFLGNDAIVPSILALYLVSIHRRIIKPPSWGDIFIALSLIDAALSFTRFVWLSILIVVVIFLVAYRPRVTSTQLLRGAVVGAFSASVVLFVIAGGGIGGMDGMASERLGDGLSINEKWLQVTLMWEAFSTSPLIGTGVGSHLSGHLRPDALPFQYEVQWFALLMQLGIVGFLPLALVATAPILPALKVRGRNIVNRDVMFLGSSYGLWLLGAFTNPYLYILNSVIVYLGFLVVSATVAGIGSDGIDPGIEGERR